MSHGYYPEGEGPGTDDSAFEHEQGCGCAECQYQREQMFQDLREDQEAHGLRCLCRICTEREDQEIQDQYWRQEQVMGCGHHISHHYLVAYWNPHNASTDMPESHCTKCDRENTRCNPTPLPCIIPKEESR